MIENSDQQRALLANQTLDISHESCPMTFVRTRLALDRLPIGQVLLVLLQGAEPIANVPRASASLGHEIVEMALGSDGITRLWIRKSAPR